MKKVNGIHIIKTLYFYEKLMGLCPFILSNKIVIKFSYIGAVYNLLITLIYTYYFILIIGLRFELHLTRESTLSIALDAFGLAFQYCSIVSAWLTLTFRQECLKKILVTFAKVNLLANNLSMTLTRYCLRKLQYIAVRLMLINLMYIVIFLSEHYLLKTYKKFEEHASTWIWFNLPKLVIYNIFGIFIELMIILQQDYRALNKVISYSFSEKIDATSFCNFSESPGVISKKLCTIAEFHENLSDILEYTTNLFSLPLLFALLASFLHLTLDSYIVYQHLLSKRMWEFNDFSSYVICLVWISTKILGFYFLCSVPDSTSAEANHTVIILIKIINNCYKVRSCRDMMKKLMLQFKQKKNYASLYGLFSLDYYLFKNIMSTSVMFLVFMFQLDDLVT
ncbi:gustatory receptor 12 [Nasonia vitripennis]|uniref:Gustatory receptor n=1 Tax=Nasonia vitripennis TaxID=7425 RepID=A0A7M6W8H7_NASVI|nr:gustatory receptor 12 [Nasonia vitripennis]